MTGCGDCYWGVCKKDHAPVKNTRPCGDPRCSTSTGICGSLTFGHGNLDNNGYWEHPCVVCEDAHERTVSQQELIILRGPSGSGKSTLAGFIEAGLAARGIKAVVLEADQFFMQPDGSCKFNPSLTGAAHAWCQNNVRGALTAGYSVIVANTHTMAREYQPYIDMARALNVPYRVISIAPVGTAGDIEQLLARNQHEVPREALERQLKRWEEVVS
jgi:predicted kinase